MKTADRFFTLVCLAAGLFCPASRLTAAEAPNPIEEIGSLRGAKVAVAMAPGEKKPLTYFAGNISTADRAELAKIAPNVTIVTGLNRQSALARAAEADGVDSRFVNPEFLAKATKLTWVQVGSAGVEQFVAMEPLVKNDAIVMTNYRGLYGPAIADHAMAMLLSMTRDLGHHAADQARGMWGRDSERRPIALDGLTMLVVGIGGIGTEIGQRAHAFGMHVNGTRRTATPAPAFFEKVGLSPELISMLPAADVVAIAVPLTAETTNMFNAAAFAAMKKGAILINIARGKVVDTAAMIEALKSGHLGGACLDVVDPEPLPASNELWKMPNVIITPHVAGHAEASDQRISALVRENIRRFGAGEPLLNTVDKQAGY